MVISSNGIALIKSFESCRLLAYPDSIGVPTIGWGHTFNVKLHTTCTQSQADEWLLEDLATAEDCVNRKVGPHISQNQFDALVSFVFNVGCAAFISSTLLRLINSGSLQLAALEFPKWDRAGTQVLPGLLRRREAEQSLFNQP